MEGGPLSSAASRSRVEGAPRHNEGVLSRLHRLRIVRGLSLSEGKPN